MNLICEYPRGRPGLLELSDDAGLEPIDPLLFPYEGIDWQSAGSPDASGYSPAPSSSASSIASPSLFTLPGGKSLEIHPLLHSPLRAQIAQTLAPAEFELLKHYLEHTCRDPSVSDDDKYVLQVGIPSLACNSRPLMQSVLALAAVCQCCDIIHPSTATYEDRARVKDMLSLAHSFHQEALHGIQTALHESRHLDHVIANAAMMGMYGSASHRARIWLAKTASLIDPLEPEHTPKYSQWIGLFRAARLAYAGLIDNTTNPDGTPKPSPSRSPSSSHNPHQYEYKVSSAPSQSLPPHPPHPLHPILAATIPSALSSLHHRAATIALTNPSPSADLQSCFTALSILSSVIAETFSTPPSQQPSRSSHGLLTFEVSPDPSAGRLSEISPWLRKYAASITSAVPSKVPRRLITSFIHKVPTAYLNLIEGMADPLQNTYADTQQWDATGLITPTVAQQLAVDIFAHWLVLILMLDDVWWIGGIGSWELGKLVATRQDVRWNGCLWMRDENWWPESMYEIHKQFEKHRGLV